MAQKEEDCITEDVVVLIQRNKTYRPFRLKKGRKVFLVMAAVESVLKSFQTPGNCILRRLLSTLMVPWGGNLVAASRFRENNWNGWKTIG